MKHTHLLRGYDQGMQLLTDMHPFAVGLSLLVLPR
jgi:hypothetical protein